MQEYLNRGDSYLVNLTFPTKVSFNGNFKDLFHNSQSQFKVLFKDQFVSYSPEFFINQREYHLFVPDKRDNLNGNSKCRTTRLRQPTKIARHATIVGLIQNDLSSYAREVRVNRFRYVEQIKVQGESLLQVSSEIEGKLMDDWGPSLGNFLWHMLLAGSISGAPKLKTLEIIQSVEVDSRGCYTRVSVCLNGQNPDSAVAISFLEK